MPVYIYQLERWPDFFWDPEKIAPLLTEVRHRQGRLLGRMEGLGFGLQSEANLDTITLDVIKSSEIEGEILNPEQVRSSVARRLGLDIAGLIPSDRNIDGIVEMMLDATQNHNDQITHERLCGWQAAMFPNGYSGIHKITVGRYRDNSPEDPMQVVSGPAGRTKVHFQAPGSELLTGEMTRLLDWCNNESTDPVLKASITHLWFLTIHPFDDGNGRIARAFTDMLLARADKSKKRFYSMSTQIRIERKEYYDILEKSQKGSLDITDWLTWFLNCLDRAIANTGTSLSVVLKKSRFWEKHSERLFNERQRLMLNKLLDGFTGKLTSSKWATIAKTSQDTAGRDINDLLEKRVLIKEVGGGRSTAYILVDEKL